MMYLYVTSMYIVSYLWFIIHEGWAKIES
jgi:hypothetical protein